MAEEAKGGAEKKDAKAGGKAAKKKKEKKLKAALYETGGALKRKNRSCPKCGPGVFMAGHSNRVTCGKCGFTEFKGGN